MKNFYYIFLLITKLFLRLRKNKKRLILSSFRKPNTEILRCLFKSFNKSIYNSFLRDLYLVTFSFEKKLFRFLNSFFLLSTDKFLFKQKLICSFYRLPFNKNLSFNNNFFSFFQSLNYYFFLKFISTNIFIYGNKFNSSVISFPKNIKRYTVLRSPHTDKKSREQFDQRINKLAIYVNSEISILLLHYLFNFYRLNTTITNKQLVSL